LIHRFDDFSLDGDRRELRRGGEIVAVQPQVFDVLEFLITNRERVVSKDDLIQAIWQGRIVSDETVSSRIHAVRQALGDRGAHQRLIRTLPRKGYRFVGHIHPASDNGETVDLADLERPGAPTALGNRPSIAVLPFQNMSDDPEQEYFVDGLVEEIITGLSRSKALFVIARNSSFTYKGRAVDVRQVGRELGVRYVLEGSVRKAGNRLRITGQLVDSANGAHLWADRFDGDLADIFELQDQITAQVIGAIAPRLELAEIERARRKTTNLDAYDYYLRAWAAIYRFSAEGSKEALSLLEKAIALDPEFALAYATQAVCYFTRRAFSWSADPAHEAAEAGRTARRAMELDSSDAQVLTFYAQTLIYNVGRLDEAVACLDQAVSADPNYANAWMWRGNARAYLGDAERAIEDLQQALRLSPLDSTIWIAQTTMANAHFLRGRYEEALSWASMALRQRPNSLSALRVAIAANALAGHLDMARQLLGRYRELDPDARLTKMREWWWFRRKEDVEKYLEGYRLAGMTE
jgi:TolB-like protein/Tfp pilus assembly protein PilF